MLAKSDNKFIPNVHTWAETFAGGRTVVQGLFTGFEKLIIISIGLSSFIVIAAMVAILIALLTVSFQRIKAAMANPMESLKAE